MAQLFTGSISSDMSDDEIGKLFMNMLIEKATSVKIDTVTKAISYDCVKTKDGWKISDGNMDEEDIANLMSANMLEAVKGLGF